MIDFVNSFIFLLLYLKIFLKNTYFKVSNKFKLVGVILGEFIRRTQFTKVELDQLFGFFIRFFECIQQTHNSTLFPLLNFIFWVILDYDFLQKKKKNWLLCINLLFNLCYIWFLYLECGIYNLISKVKCMSFVDSYIEVASKKFNFDLENDAQNYLSLTFDLTFNFLHHLV